MTTIPSSAAEVIADPVAFLRALRMRKAEPIPDFNAEAAARRCCRRGDAWGHGLVPSHGHAVRSMRLSGSADVEVRRDARRCAALTR
jgi:hypothetical protein